MRLSYVECSSRMAVPNIASKKHMTCVIINYIVRERWMCGRKVWELSCCIIYEIIVLISRRRVLKFLYVLSGRANMEKLSLTLSRVFSCENCREWVWGGRSTSPRLSTFTSAYCRSLPWVCVLRHTTTRHSSSAVQRGKAYSVGVWEWKCYAIANGHREAKET